MAARMSLHVSYSWRAKGREGALYPPVAGGLNAAAPRVADKMPDNYLYLGLIAALMAA
jgi:hypothetical protein